MTKKNIGLIGIGVMGQNLVLNIESKGFSVAVYDLVSQKTADFISKKAKGKNIQPTYSLNELVNSLERPRKIILMVNAGSPVDESIESLVPMLNKGDLLIDGGNSYFKDTIRRESYLENKSILYIGTGISGGEEGALYGPAIMPGGKLKAYELIEDLFKKISAKASDGKPCVSYMGPDGAGHFVKMVHNGIEYGDMALIGECVWALKAALGYTTLQIADIMKNWNSKKDILSSYLIEITGQGLRQPDKDSGMFLVDRIADITRMKGTGTWAIQSGLELLVPIPTIASAVFSREASQDKDIRLALSNNLKYSAQKYKGDPSEFVSIVHDALYIAKISSYAQGFALLNASSKSYDWNLDMGKIAAGWRGGCIIRAQFLSEITKEYNLNPRLLNLISAPTFKNFINENIKKLAKFIGVSHTAGVPVICMSSSLDYILQITSPVLVSAQVQAQQRDYFGAHGYFKLVKGKSQVLLSEDGSYKEFHTEWMEKDRPEKAIIEDFK